MRRVWKRITRGGNRAAARGRRASAGSRAESPLGHSSLRAGARITPIDRAICPFLNSSRSSRSLPPKHSGLRVKLETFMEHPGPHVRARPLGS